MTEDKRLSPTASAAIEAQLQSGIIFVSSITTREIALLVQFGRLAFTADLTAWIARVANLLGFVFIPIDNYIALAAIDLSGLFHREPANRLIIATARKLSYPIITADEKIRAHPPIRTIW